MTINNISLMGLSGYDFTAIIEASVSNYSRPLLKMQEQQLALGKTKDAWRDVNTRLAALDKTLEALRQAVTWTATSATSSNESLLKVTSSAGATAGNYNIKIFQLAGAQTAVSKVMGEAEGITSPTDGTVIEESIFRIKVGDKETEISLKAGASLEEIAQEINEAKAGVSASVLKVSGGYQLALISEEVGEENAATFEPVSGNVLTALGIADENGNPLNITQEAQDAKISINGIEITSSSNTITTAIKGLTLNLNAADENTTVIVKVSADEKTAEKAVQAFVDQYNSVMNFIESKMQYNKDTGVKGDLFGDPILQAIQSRLRSMVGGIIANPTGPFTLLSEIGISTSALNYGKSAALEFDTKKFAEALEKNLESVANLFGAGLGIASRDEDEPQGLANIMKSYLKPMIEYGGTFAKAQEGYTKQISDLKDRMQDFQDKIETYRENLTQKYSRLESQLVAISSQSQWLYSQVAALTAFYSEWR
ncbi:MAG: flagellar filament capping protein FliD [Desulfitobacteriia bacterium]|jgi:flagellar hook-associated protein 2